MAATAATAAVTAVPSSCSKRESSIAAGADLPKKAKKGRAPPPEEEMEAFFAAAESGVARSFAAKYNYDVAKDAPMDGRYEWVATMWCFSCNYAHQTANPV